MPFPPEVRIKVLIRCARICCLCFKQCGTKIEVHHIVHESEGGSGTEENALPVCFDCHAEVGSYNDKHPKGTKYRPAELKVRRDALYGLVESGTLQAQILVLRLRPNPADTADSVTKAVEDLSGGIAAGREAKEFLDLVLNPSSSLDALPSKLRLLGSQDGAWVIDNLVDATKKSARAVKVLSRVLPLLSDDQQLVVAESAVRNVTLFGNVAQKVAALNELEPKQFEILDEGVLLAFFNDVFDIVRRDQFDEVNELMPALVNFTEVLPKSLWGDYVLLLIGQAGSDSYKGAPAAQRALKNLPDKIAKAGLIKLTPNFVGRLGFRTWDATQSFAKQYQALSRRAHAKMIIDVSALSWGEFSRKYCDE